MRRDWAVSPSSHEKRQEGKESERHQVYRSGHGVPAGEVVTYGQTPKPEYQREFRDQKEAKSDKANAQPLR